MLNIFFAVKIFHGTVKILFEDCFSLSNCALLTPRGQLGVCFQPSRDEKDDMNAS